MVLYDFRGNLLLVRATVLWARSQPKNLVPYINLESEYFILPVGKTTESCECKARLVYLVEWYSSHKNIAICDM